MTYQQLSSSSDYIQPMAKSDLKSARPTSEKDSDYNFNEKSYNSKSRFDDDFGANSSSKPVKTSYDSETGIPLVQNPVQTMTRYDHDAQAHVNISPVPSKLRFEREMDSVTEGLGNSQLEPSTSRVGNQKQILAPITSIFGGNYHVL